MEQPESTATSAGLPVVPALRMLLESVAHASRTASPELATGARALSSRAADLNELVTAGWGMWVQTAPHRSAIARLFRR